MLEIFNHKHVLSTQDSSQLLNFRCFTHRNIVPILPVISNDGQLMVFEHMLPVVNVLHEGLHTNTTLLTKGPLEKNKITLNYL